MAEVWTPQRAATRLTKVLETFSCAHGATRFPVDVPELARETAAIFGWNDRITKVESADIKGFDGALFPNDARTEWMLLYNGAVPSPGRIRFTQAHELGHYVLHRSMKDEFECSDADMLSWSQDDKDMEGQADMFASYLLMPLDDFRRQVPASIDLDVLAHCADRYGVSLTAAALKWLQYTDEKAVMVVSSNGFMNWAWASEPASKIGAFFRTRKNVIPIPDGSLAANGSIRNERAGQTLPAKVWFPDADPSMQIREMKLQADRYESVVTLLQLPRSADVRPPWGARR
tara:strand:- start:1516 stop:2379 length:864 start_codon:yes stop_codon:yes gene_type:complete